MNLPSTDGQNKMRCLYNASPYFVSERPGSSAGLKANVKPRSKLNTRVEQMW